MVRKRSSEVPQKILTEVELELMQVIWSTCEKLGSECTVRDVLDALPKERDLAYTSVATMLKILEQKGFLKSHKLERTLGYSAEVTRDEYEGVSLRHVADNVFQGNPGSMVMKLLNDTELSKEELQNIRALLNERLKS